MNLYRHRPENQGTTARLTDFKDFDIKFPSPGRQGHRLRERRFHLSFRSEESSKAAKGHGATSRRTWSRGRGGLREVSKNITNFEISPPMASVPFSAPAATCSPSRPRRTDPQPHRHVRRPRAQRQVVARRQDASPSSPTPPARTKFYIAPQDGSESCSPTHQRRRYLQVRHRLVSRQPEDPLGGQEAPPAVRRRGDEKGDARRSGQGLGNPRIRLVAGQQVDRLHPSGSRAAWRRFTSTRWSRTRLRGDRRLVSPPRHQRSVPTASTCSSSPIGIFTPPIARRSGTTFISDMATHLPRHPGQGRRRLRP